MNISSSVDNDRFLGCHSLCHFMTRKNKIDLHVTRDRTCVLSVLMKPLPDELTVRGWFNVEIECLQDNLAEMETLDQEENQVCQDHLDRQALLEHQASAENPDLKDLRVREERVDNEENKGLRVHRVHLDPVENLDLLDPLEPRVLPAHREDQDLEVTRVCEVKVDNPEHQVPLETEASLDPQDHKDPRDNRVPQDPAENLDRTEHPVSAPQDREVNGVRMEPQGLPDHEVSLDLLDLQVLKDHPDSAENLDLPDLLDHEVNQELLEHQVRDSSSILTSSHFSLSEHVISLLQICEFPC